jgi:hypothetical protein
MSALRKRILPTLAVLVVACAQVFGVQRGYACAHGEESVETKAEHCHRVIVDDHEHEAPCEESSSKECGDQGEKEHHAPLSVDMQAAPSSLATVGIPVFVAVQVAELPVQEWALMLTLVEDVSMKTPLDTGGDSPPSAAVQVARCMVILV